MISSCFRILIFTKRKCENALWNFSHFRLRIFAFSFRKYIVLKDKNTKWSLPASMKHIYDKKKKHTQYMRDEEQKWILPTLHIFGKNAMSCFHKNTHFPSICLGNLCTEWFNTHIGNSLKKNWVWAHKIV